MGEFTVAHDEYLKERSIRSSLIDLPDGRQLGFQDMGDEGAPVIFYEPGAPHTQIGLLDAAALQGVRIILMSRPGYGDSTRQEDRTAADAAWDVRAVADKLGIDRFAVAGRSGGGPHALGCATLLPDRVSAAFVAVSLAPRNAKGLDWYAGMGSGNVEAYKRLEKALDPDQDMQSRRSAMAAHLSYLANVALALQSGKFIAADILPDSIPESDREVLGSMAMRATLLVGFMNGTSGAANLLPLHGGSTLRYLAGQFDDHVAFLNDWGFDPRDNTRPVVYWHGTKDIYSPIGHSRWLAEVTPNSILDEAPDKGHFGALQAFYDYIPWLVSGSQEPQLSRSSRASEALDQRDDVALEEAEKLARVSCQDLTRYVVSLAPSMSFTNQELWQKNIEQCQTDAMMGRALAFAERWARLMQMELAKGRALADIWSDTRDVADFDGMSGGIMGTIVRLLARCWVHGEELWQLYGTTTGNEGLEYLLRSVG